MRHRGHAAAGRSLPAATIAVQWVHVVASGCWLGGLAALLLGVRGVASEITSSAVRRFSTMAGVAIVMVAATGIWRSVNELASWNDLTTTVYGRALLAKAAILLVLGALGALNRWHSVVRAALDLRPLRRAGGAELVLALAALVAAATLGASPPPAAGQVLPGLSASGTDFSTTVRASLSAASDQPGPNRFVVRVADYDSKQPVAAAEVTLHFTPLDDPDVPSTSLALAPAPDGTYVGSGANLAFDGRWRVGVRVQQKGTSTEVPLDLETRGAPQFVSLEHNPGQPPEYACRSGGSRWIRFSRSPSVRSEQGSRGRLRLDRRRTARSPESSSPHPRRAIRPPCGAASGGNQFVADIDLDKGRNRITAVARTPDGTPEGCAQSRRVLMRR